MKIDFICCPDIPCLAWGAVMTKGERFVSVYHGNRVEIRDDGFVEGAWDGEYGDFPPVSATVVCGSGAAVQQGSVRFWSGTDNTFPIHSIRKEGKLFVSNSFVFALVLAGEELDPCYPFYYDDFVRMIRMGFKSNGRLRTGSRHPLRLNFGHLMTVDRNLKTSFSRFPVCPRFTDYQSYYRLLADSVESVLQNAQDPGRRFPFRPVTACSGGYDANACAVLAAQAGCRDAVTFFSPASDGKRTDSGAEVAACLNLRCIEKEKTGFLDYEDLSEFCVTPHSMSCPYIVFESELRNSIFVMGNNGDNVWRPDRVEVYNDNRTPWARFKSGYGLVEFRLRVGFLVFQVPYIGSLHNRDLYVICHAPEMERWRIGGDYDRPIPRRILEEAGVPRQSFGTSKMASAQAHFYRKNMHSTALRQDYACFMNQRSESVNKLMDVYWRKRHEIRTRIIRRLAPKDKQYVAYTPLRRAFSFLVNSIARLDWYDAFTLQYCFRALNGRYQVEHVVDAAGGRSSAE